MAHTTDYYVLDCPCGRVYEVSQQPPVEIRCADCKRLLVFECWREHEVSACNDTPTGIYFKYAKFTHDIAVELQTL